MSEFHLGAVARTNRANEVEMLNVYHAATQISQTEPEVAKTTLMDTLVLLRFSDCYQNFMRHRDVKCVGRP